MEHHRRKESFNHDEAVLLCKGSGAMEVEQHFALCEALREAVLAPSRDVFGIETPPGVGDESPLMVMDGDCDAAGHDTAAREPNTEVSAGRERESAFALEMWMLVLECQAKRQRLIRLVR